MEIIKIKVLLSVFTEKNTPLRVQTVEGFLKLESRLLIYP